MRKRSKNNRTPELIVFLIAAVLSLLIGNFPAIFYDTETDTLPVDPDPLPQLGDEQLFIFSYYSQLNETEKMVYDRMLTAAQNGKDSILIINLDPDTCYDDCLRAIRALTYDRPDLFWLACGYDPYSIYHTDGGVSIRLNLVYYDYWEYTLDREKKQQELAEAVEKIADAAREYETHYDRLEFVHDYLVANAYYDYDALDEYYEAMHDPVCEYIFSAYGCLVNGKTVCAGYAKAFQLIMKELGYGCMYVSGDAGGSHAWNCVFVEDEGYYVDVTWDDPDWTHDEAKYEYFCITDEALAKTHTVSEHFDIPACTSEKYGYYKYNGFWMETYSFSEARKIINKQSNRRSVSIQFALAEELEKACTDLFDKDRIFWIPPFSDAKSIRYSVNDAHLTLTIWSEEE